MKKVLIIDNEEIVLEVLEEVLVENLKFDVETTGFVSEGISKLGQNDYHLLIIDVWTLVTPLEKFIQDVRKIEMKDGKPIPILVVFSMSEVISIDRVKDDQVSQIQKPFKIDEFLEKVEGLLG